MKNATLKQFRYFDALVRQGHFGRAADLCAISQPALSMQIKELEHIVGCQLIERHARNIRLTTFGEAFATRIRAILRAVDDLDEFARAASNAMISRLRLGIIPTIAPYMLPAVIGHLGYHLPDLDLHVRETTTPKLLQELDEGRIDAAILALPISDPALTEVTLFAEEFMLVRPAEDADKPVPDAATLKEMRLLLLEEGHCFRDQALSFCKLKSGLPNEGLDGSALSTLVQMVGAGIGVTLIPEMAVKIETSAASVAVARFDQPRPGRTIGMVWRKGSALAPQLSEVSEVVRTSFAAGK